MREEKTVLFICGARADYVRNALNIKKLKQNLRVIEITSNSRYYFLRLPIVMAKFLLCLKKYDFIFVGFLAQPLMPILRLLTNKPIIFDAFISLYDTMCFDRKIFKPDSLVGKLAFWLDKKSCEWAEIIITDTNTHADYFSQTFHIDRNKFQTIYLGADADIFYPKNIELKNENKKFTIFYYGSGLPLQGIDVILKAAKILETDDSLIFRVVGPMRKKYHRLITELNLKNVEFIDWIDYKNLPDEIAQADICLGGHFSTIDKARRVISGKTYQFLAIKKPVIVGDNPANKEIFKDQKDVLMVKMGSTEALAAGIIKLKNDKKLIEKISENGYQITRNIFAQNNQCFKNLINSI